MFVKFSVNAGHCVPDEVGSGKWEVGSGKSAYSSIDLNTANTEMCSSFMHYSLLFGFEKRKTCFEIQVSNAVQCVRFDCINKLLTMFGLVYVYFLIILKFISLTSLKRCPFEFLQRAICEYAHNVSHLMKSFVALKMMIKQSIVPMCSNDPTLLERSFKAFAKTTRLSQFTRDDTVFKVFPGSNVVEKLYRIL
uniref:Uncharacterized protein n=1 Tax=Glossina austeni TaxID=7395 RepID=A0A1A9V4G0_GLOAU